MVNLYLHFHAICVVHKLFTVDRYRSSFAPLAGLAQTRSSATHGAVRTDEFDYQLPTNLIAQHPAPTRDHSRLLVYRRNDETRSHRQFSELPQLLQPSDVLVLNDSKVIPARIFGSKRASGGEIEILLLDESKTNEWWAMLRPGKRARLGTEIEIHNLRKQPSGITAVVSEKNPEGHCRLCFTGVPDITIMLAELGEVPLPPYIHRTREDDFNDDRLRYQTVFASEFGSVAAPTAGLHFTERLLAGIRNRGVTIAFVTLHVGLGTFAPVKADSLDEHVMHFERFRLSAETVGLIEAAKSRGGRVVAVGTTTLRALESVAATNQGRLVATEGRTSIFIRPPYCFQSVDALITNFHLPRSTLLMLVSAFASPGEIRGRDEMLNVYSEAINEGYRFYSYGDAMMIH